MVYPMPSGVALQIYERGYKYIFNFQPNAAEYLGKSYAGADEGSGASPIRCRRRRRSSTPTTSTPMPRSPASPARSATIAGTDKVIDLAPGALADAGIEVVFEQQWPEEGFSDWIGLANSIKAQRRRHGHRLHRLARRSDPARARLQDRRLPAVDRDHGPGHPGRVPRAARRCRRTACMIQSAWHPAVEWVGVLGGKDFSNQDFIDEFKAKFGKDPDEDNAIPFATCQGMAQAIAATNSTDNTVLRDWLAARTADDPVKTILGDFHWDEKGLPVDKPFLITQWQNGELKFVYPLGQFPGTSDLVWPKPDCIGGTNCTITRGPALGRAPSRRRISLTGGPTLPLLEVRDAAKSFGGIKAVDGCSFTVEEGTHHRADRAERRRQDDHVQHDQRPAPGRRRRDPVRGREHRAPAAAPITRRGISRTFQISRQLGDLTVLENVVVQSPARGLARPAQAEHPRRGARARRWSSSISSASPTSPTSRRRSSPTARRS